MQEFDYGAFFRGVPIAPGDTIDVSSDLLSILLFCRKRKLTFHADCLIDALQELVGENGTVMIRAFNWDFCHGVPFDIRNSPSRTGSLGNYAAMRKDFSRTQHPIYSWWVWGKDKDELCKITEPSAFAEKGIFGFLYKKCGKLIGIGNMQHTAMTQIHYAEVTVQVPFRREKFFSSPYIDENGRTVNRTYSMHVRPLNIEVSYETLEGEETQNHMRTLGIRVDHVYQQELLCTTFDLHKATDFFKEDLLFNDGKKVVQINRHAGVTASVDLLQYAEY